MILVRPRLPRLTRGLSGDLRLAARRLLATPVFTVFAVLSLAIGVAVTTAVYSIVDSLLLRNSGIRDPEQVVFVVTPYQGRLLQGSISEPDFVDLRAAQTSFSRVSASTLITVAVSSASTTELLATEAVEGAYFSTLGVTAALGRVIQPADDAGASRVVVLSHSLWRARFAADPKIVGQNIRIAGHPFEVVGVTAASFEGARGLPVGGTRLWIPLAAERVIVPSSMSAARDRRRLLVFGRLAPSVTVARASAELGVIASTLDRAFPPPATATQLRASERPWRAKSVVEVTDEDNILHRFGRTVVALIALVLVVACTNLANLVLARGTTRQRELAVKCALGASRWRLVREQCTESFLIAAAGAVASYIAFQGLRVLMSTDLILMLPLGGGRWTMEIRPAPNMAALGMALVSLLLSLVVFGLEPAWQLTRSLDVRGALVAGSGVGNPRSKRQRMLLRWQVGISAGFFIIATMFVKYTVEEVRHDSGVDLERLAVTVMNFRTQAWDEARVLRTLDRILEEGRRDPSVEAMSASTGMPFGLPAAMRVMLSLPERAGEQHAATGIGATPSFFRTLGVPILRGRGFDERDHAGASLVVVLSAFTAQQMFGTVDAVGRQLIVGGRPNARIATVIGVVRDTDVRQVLSGPGAFLYLPLAQSYDPSLTIAVRSTDASRAVRALREAVHRADPDLAVEMTGTGRAMLAGPSALVRAAGMTALALGALTLLLAMVGLFGIQSHIVTQRTREVGVRMSLGATAAQIKRLVLKDGYRPVIEGLGMGVFIGLVGRAIVLAYLDVEGSVVDPWMLLVAPVPLILAAFGACYLPARRAASVDPNVALRHE